MRFEQKATPCPNCTYCALGEVGIDPALSEGKSRELEKASQRAYKRGIELEGIRGVAEELPFESGTFDAVVSTLVFCTVRDPDEALREVSVPSRSWGWYY